jgi:hypothetical protein
MFSQFTACSMLMVSTNMGIQANGNTGISYRYYPLLVTVSIESNG